MPSSGSSHLCFALYQNCLKEDQQDLGSVLEGPVGSQKVREGPGRSWKGPVGSGVTWKGPRRVLEGSKKGTGRVWEGSGKRTERVQEWY